MESSKGDCPQRTFEDVARMDAEFKAKELSRGDGAEDAIALKALMRDPLSKTLRQYFAKVKRIQNDCEG